MRYGAFIVQVLSLETFAGRSEPMPREFFDPTPEKQ